MHPRAKKCILVGYPKSVKGYKLWDHVSIKYFNSRNVTFVEHEALKSKENNRNVIINSNHNVEVEVPPQVDSSETKVQTQDDNA